MGGEALPASHGAEVPFMFHAEDLLMPSDYKLSTAFARFWISFAIDGAPGWPAYDLSTNAAIVWGDDESFRLVPDHRNRQCDFWDSHPQRWAGPAKTRNIFLGR